jgi:hypothetical protein
MEFAGADDFWNGYDGIWNCCTGGMGFINWRYLFETTALTAGMGYGSASEDLLQRFEQGLALINSW